MKVFVDEEKCIGCGVCEGMCPQCFKMENGSSKVMAQGCDSCDLEEVAKSCPVDAIIIEQQES